VLIIALFYELLKKCLNVSFGDIFNNGSTVSDNDGTDTKCNSEIL